MWSLDSLISSRSFFPGGFHDGTYGYAVPYDNAVTARFGTIARFNLADFTTNTVDMLDLTTEDTSLIGFQYGFAAGAYGYLVPYHDASVYSGKVVRFRFDDFSTSSVEVLDLTDVNNQLVGYHGGFSDGCVPEHTHARALPEHTRHQVTTRIPATQDARLPDAMVQRGLLRSCLHQPGALLARHLLDRERLRDQPAKRGRLLGGRAVVRRGLGRRRLRVCRSVLCGRHLGVPRQDGAHRAS